MEAGLVEKIKESLQIKSNIRVPFKTFIKMWAPKNDNELTCKLLDFAKNNNLDYVVILENNMSPTYVRFWNRDYTIKQIELKGKGDN